MNPSHRAYGAPAFATFFLLSISQFCNGQLYQPASYAANGLMPQQQYLQQPTNMPQYSMAAPTYNQFPQQQQQIPAYNPQPALGNQLNGYTNPQQPIQNYAMPQQQQQQQAIYAPNNQPAYLPTQQVYPQQQAVQPAYQQNILPTNNLQDVMNTGNTGNGYYNPMGRSMSAPPAINQVPMQQQSGYAGGQPMNNQIPMQTSGMGYMQQQQPQQMAMTGQNGFPNQPQAQNRFQPQMSFPQGQAGVMPQNFDLRQPVSPPMQNTNATRVA